MVICSAQQAAFEAALVEDFDSIQAKVDVRTAECRNPTIRTKAILRKLERGVGFVKCNTQVLDLLRGAGCSGTRQCWHRHGCRWPSGGRLS